MNFNWLVYQVECPNVQTTNGTEGVISFTNIGDIHQFIGHCLIPLDP